MNSIVVQPIGPVLHLAFSSAGRRALLGGLLLGLGGCVSPLPELAPAPGQITLVREGFTLTYDCENRTALRYAYQLNADKGNVKRPRGFELDPDLPAGCPTQLSARGYSAVPGWDRGHLVPSNQMDHSNLAIRQAHYMSNIVPQAARFNQGIWVQTEEVSECYRDLAPVQVYGGLVYDNPVNDFFLESHGIRTPDAFWKTILTTDAEGKTRAISWYIPNQATLEPLDRYILSIAELEALLGTDSVGIQASEEVKAQKPARTWPRPRDCDLG
ncbi:DNA/RNA non-specific endonuclease [Pseudomonas gingeri]|uniref:DNA/RNA non-specific endonuclease n=1 Tax=Pseudomonas gingeri TaxID=117681 RepID=UPI0015A362F1|nr:DNA/RNA non-specific endonuclease [Pseudomonas gingeri]NWD67728.1 DNA/RNA non-specific endonuclease [Pseudomonas gingeri]